MGNRDYTGGASPLALKTALGPTDTSFDVESVIGTWPQGDAGGLLPFFISIDRGLPTEEKILCSHRSGTTFTVASGGRGSDDTLAVPHTAGAVVEHIWTAVDARESNRHVNATQGVHGLSSTDRVIGASEFTAGLDGKVSVSGDTMTGDLILPGPPAFPLGATTKQSVLDEEAARIAAVNGEATARANADAAHEAAADPHPVYTTGAELAAALAGFWTKAESDARFVDTAGDTMTGPLVVDTASGSGVGFTVKRDAAAIEFWSENSPAGKQRWREQVAAADGRFSLVSVDDAGANPVSLLAADRDGGLWAPALPAQVRQWSATGSLEFLGAEDTWANLPGAHNLTATVTLPHRALCLVEFGVWASMDQPTSGSGYFALSFILGGATVQSDPLFGATWGLIPRVTTRAPETVTADETINGSRTVLLEAGTTNVQLKGFKNYSVAQGSTVDTFTAYPMIQVTPLRFVA